MKATIDIKTPSGQSLEWFPRTIAYVSNSQLYAILEIAFNDELDREGSCTLHKGDTITIRIEE